MDKRHHVRNKSLNISCNIPRRQFNKLKMSNDIYAICLHIPNIYLYKREQSNFVQRIIESLTSYFINNKYIHKNIYIYLIVMIVNDSLREDIYGFYERRCDPFRFAYDCHRSCINGTPRYPFYTILLQFTSDSV